MAQAFIHKAGLILLVVCCVSCASLPKGSYGTEIPDAPDYSSADLWAALPEKIDSADAVPLQDWDDVQASSAVDVFYIHPTTYIGKAGEKNWNADLSDQKCNANTDKYPIRYQASLFNGVGKVYAPRYRQAHLNSFYTKRTADAAQALELAYVDIHTAFQYYLEHYNQGRPFIIASHSQGTFHAKKLLHDFVDGTPLQEKFITAYLVGLAVSADHFETIKPCTLPDENNCFCSWRTFRKGFVPKKLHYADSNIVTTNPVTWEATKLSSSREEHEGGVLRDFQKLYPGLVTTTVHDDLLWVNKPKFPGSFLLTTKNYHIADYNFFYADIRQNAQDRVHAFLRNQ